MDPQLPESTGRFSSQEFFVFLSHSVIDVQKGQTTVLQNITQIVHRSTCSERFDNF